METVAGIESRTSAAPVAPSRWGCLRKPGPRAALVGVALWHVVQIVGSLPWLVTRTVQVQRNGIFPPTETMVRAVNWPVTINAIVSTVVLIPILARLRRSTIQLEADVELGTIDTAARKQLGLGRWHSVRLSAPMRRCVHLTEKEQRYQEFAKQLAISYRAVTARLAERQEVATHQAALEQFRAQAALLRSQLAH